MKVWMRARLAPLSASAAREMSRSFARESEQIVESLIAAQSPDRFEVAVGTGGKAGLDHVYPQALELACNAHFLVPRHRRSGRLFAVTQGGIENDEFVGHGMLLLQK